MGAVGDRDQDKKDVCLRVGEGTEPVVGFLAGGVEEAEGVGGFADSGSVSRDFGKGLGQGRT